MQNNTETKMGESYLYYLDLTSNKDFDIGSNTIAKEILDLDFNSEILELISESIEYSKSPNGKIVIYFENELHDQEDPEIFLEIIKELEEIVDGGFESRSRFKYEIEFPFHSKTWIKEGYEWELAFDENDTYLEDGNERWEDPDWNEQ